MEDALKEKLDRAGVDVASAMDRFLGNEKLLIKFLGKFPKDGSYALFKSAMEEKRYDDAFKAAHTLKGLSANLSLTGMFEVISSEVEFLRGSMYEEAEKMLPEVVQEYEKVKEILENL